MGWTMAAIVTVGGGTSGCCSEEATVGIMLGSPVPARSWSISCTSARVGHGLSRVRHYYGSDTFTASDTRIPKSAILNILTFFQFHVLLSIFG